MNMLIKDFRVAMLIDGASKRQDEGLALVGIVEDSQSSVWSSFSNADELWGMISSAFLSQTGVDITSS